MEEIETKRGPGRPRNPAPVVETPVVDTMRNEMRHEMYEASPQEAAARRTAELLAQFGGNIPEEKDDMVIPEHLKDPDWDYVWRRYSSGNQEDVNNMNQAKDNGWEHIHPKTPGFQRWVQRGWKEDFILYRGMTPMKRPMAISDLFNKRSRMSAIERIEINDKKLKSEPFAGAPRDNAGNPIAAHGVSGAKRTIVGPIPD